MEANKKRDLAAVASIPVTMTLANSMLIPVLPLLRQHLHISSVLASLVITVYAGIAILCIPVAGYWSDRFGRKRIIVPSLAIAAAGGIVSALAAWLMEGMAAYWVIIAGRFIQGIGSAGAFPIAIPLVGDMFRNDKDISSGLGIVETSNTLGKVLSPVLGSALAAIVWYLPFMSIPVICIASMAAVILFVKTPHDERSQTVTLSQFIRPVKRVFRRNAIWLGAVFALGGISMFVLFGFLFYLSEILEEQHHIEGIWKGLLLAVPLSAVCVSSFFSGKFVGENKQRMKWLIVCGTVLLTASTASTALLDTQSRLVLLSLLSVGGIGIGVSLPSLDALITEGISKEQRGTITSLYSSMRFIGVASGPLVTSMLLQRETALFYSYAGLAAASVLIGLLAIRPDHVSSEDPSP